MTGATPAPSKPCKTWASQRAKQVASTQPGPSLSASPSSTAVTDTLTSGDTDQPRVPKPVADWKLGRIRGGSGVCPALLLAVGPRGAERGGVGRGPRRFQARGTLRLLAWDSGTRNRGGSAWRGPAQPGDEGSRLEGNGLPERSPSAAWGRARRSTQRQTGRAHYVTLSRGPGSQPLYCAKLGGESWLRVRC